MSIERLAYVSGKCSRPINSFDLNRFYKGHKNFVLYSFFFLAAVESRTTGIKIPGILSFLLFRFFSLPVLFFFLSLFLLDLMDRSPSVSFGLSWFGSITKPFNPKDLLAAIWKRVELFVGLLCTRCLSTIDWRRVFFV